MKGHLKSKSEAGFTLLEILVALGLMAALFLMMNTSMVDITRARNQILLQNEALHGLETAYGRLFQDLSTAFMAHSKFNNRREPVEIEFVGSAKKLDFASLSHLHYIQDKKDSEQHQVGLYLRSNDDDTKSLMRRSTDKLLPEIDTGGLTFELLNNIEDLEFLYYDANQRTWKSEWDTRSVAFAGKLPQTVQVKLSYYSNVDSSDLDEVEKVAVPFIWYFRVALYDQKIEF